MFRKSTIRSDWSPENDAWPPHRRFDNSGIIVFFAKPWWNRLLLGLPRLQRGLHGRCRNGEVEEANSGLIGFELTWHSDSPYTESSRRKRRPSCTPNSALLFRVGHQLRTATFAAGYPSGIVNMISGRLAFNAVTAFWDKSPCTLSR